MSQCTVQQLPPQTVKLITSTQVVTSVATTVKELIENSIDAGAKVVQVRLENYGLDLIEVKDDGSGVSYDNVQKMFLPGYTSKIRQYEDLDKLCSYGFRGEALAAICKIANVTITTKTHLDTLAMTYEIDSTGLPVSSKPSHINNGTVIAVSSLFSNVPVRRLFLSSKKKLSDELKKIEQIVQSLSLIHPELTISLIHNKCPIWRKNSVKGIKQSFMQVAGLRTVSKMEYLNYSSNQINLDLIVPKKNSENIDCVFSNSKQNLYTYVNKRPVDCKILSQPVQEHIFHHYSNSNITSKIATCLVSVNIPPEQLDVNLEPNKTKVFLKNQMDYIKIIDETLKNYYGHDFICTTLTNLEESFIEDEAAKQKSKRSRQEPPDKSVGEKRTEVFKKKNKDWDLEIINDDCAVNSKRPRLESSDNSVGEKGTEVFKEKNKDWDLEIINDDCAVNSKRPRLESSDNSVGEKGTEVFKEKNKDWDLVIINDDCAVDSNLSATDMFKPDETIEEMIQPQSLCSQINSTNSVLSQQEVSEFNTIINETNHKLVFSTNASNSEVRLIERNDIQCRTAEKPILKEWPCRPKVPVSTQPSISQFGSCLDSESKAVSEIAEEIERSAEEWSTEMLRAMKSEANEHLTSDSLEEEVNQFDLSLQSISSQMGKKEMKAFTKFARIMRPKISQEFPNIKFTQIAGILTERWKALTPDEVKYYEKMSDIVEINRKSHHEAKAMDQTKPPDKPKKSPAKKTKNLKTLLENMKKKWTILRPPRKEISMPASLDITKKLLQESDSELPVPDIQIIGKLHPSSNWMYVKGKEIGHVRHQGLKELIVFQKMLNSLSISRKKSEKEIRINEENLGTVLWNILISLESEYETSSGMFLITSDVITKNGFSIELDKKEDVVISANVTEVAELIPYFGISELKEVLGLYQKNGEFGGLASWRPTAVCNYITNEAVRIAQESFQPPDLEEMNDMLNTYHLCFRHLPPLCLHSKEIFPSIYNLQNLSTNISGNQQDIFINK